MSTILIGFEPEVLTEAQLDQVRQAAPDMRLMVTPDRAEMAAVLDDVEIAAALVPGSLLVAAPRLRWFHAWSAGVDWLLRQPGAIEHRFVLTSSSGIHAIQITEHVLALLLAFARRPARSHPRPGRRRHLAAHGESGALRAGRQDAAPGRVGRDRPAHRTGDRSAGTCGCSAFAATAVGLVAWGRARAGIESGWHDLLPEADFVVLTDPVDPRTRDLIGERELRLMKRDALPGQRRPGAARR